MFKNLIIIVIIILEGFGTVNAFSTQKNDSNFHFYAVANVGRSYINHNVVYQWAKNEGLDISNKNGLGGFALAGYVSFPYIPFYFKIQVGGTKGVLSTNSSQFALRYATTQIGWHFLNTKYFICSVNAGINSSTYSFSFPEGNVPPEVASYRIYGYQLRQEVDMYAIGLQISTKSKPKHRSFMGLSIDYQSLASQQSWRLGEPTSSSSFVGSKIPTVPNVSNHYLMYSFYIGCRLF